VADSIGESHIVTVTPNSQSLSQETFELVLARAIELDEEGNARMSPNRAREVALELGVSPGAWDSAFAAQMRTRSRRSKGVRLPTVSAVRHLAIATGSIALGIVAGIAERLPSIGTPDLWTEATVGTLFAVTLGLFVHNAVRKAPARFQVDLATWWLPFPVGFLIGNERLWGDPFAFALGSWAACAILGGGGLHLLGRTRRGATSQAGHVPWTSAH
jgi:hypothetical protein